MNLLEMPLHSPRRETTGTTCGVNASGGNWVSRTDMNRETDLPSLPSSGDKRHSRQRTDVLLGHIEGDRMRVTLPDRHARDRRRIGDKTAGHPLAMYLSHLGSGGAADAWQKMLGDWLGTIDAVDVVKVVIK